MALLLSVGLSQAQMLEVEPGTRYTQSPGSRTDVGCGEVLVEGELNTQAGSSILSGDWTISPGGTTNAAGGTISAGGNWSNQGAFLPGSSTVILTGECVGEDVEILGTTRFHNLTLPNGDYCFPPGEETTVLGVLNLGSGARLFSCDGGTAFIQLGPDASVVGTPALFNVVIRPFSGAPIPSAAPFALTLLGLLLAGLGMRGARRASMSFFARVGGSNVSKKHGASS